MPTVMQGDCIELMRETIADNSIDAIVTDPPYGLGFMGKAWDELPPGLPWAQECLRVLKPGGHLLAFGGTRTWHRLAVAVEDAGFEIRDSLAWMHGQGFPKGGSQMKPAFEPIVLGRKQFTGSMAANVERYGTGSLQIDAARIAGDVPHTTQGQSKNAGDIYGADQRNLREFIPNDAGRWPANVMLDEDMAAALDQQSGILKGGAFPSKRGADGDDRNAYGAFKGQGNLEARKMGHGGASRFFYVAKAPTKERPKVDGVAHPTVKPLTLMRWLVRLVTPPGGTVLDTFAGSGTTLEAAMLEGFPSIGIEREMTYLPLIFKRLGVIA